MAGPRTSKYVPLFLSFFFFFRHKDLPLSRTWLLADFLGYISTMSAGRKLVDSGSRELEELANE